jgi:hypothetical protein
MGSYRAKELQEHFQRLVGLGCLVSGQHPEIHHCKGGSMLEIIGMHGGSMKVSDWLTIPLAHEYHQGRFGVERGVRTWEAKFGTQIRFLLVVVDRLGVDVFEKAGVSMPLAQIRSTYGAARTD